MYFPRLRYQVSQLNWLIVVFTLLVFLLLLRLGYWQNARALEKELRLERIQKMTEQAPLTLSNVIELESALEDTNDLPVEIVGNFNDRNIFLLDNQVNHGQIGYRVLQVVNVDEFAVLVNLGWIAGSVDRQTLPQITALSGEHKFTGHIRIIEKGIVLAEQQYTNDLWPLRVQQIELDEFSALIGQELLPFAVYLAKDEVIGYSKNWQAIVMPPEKHRAYAFQWFSLAIAWLILIISASVWFAKNDDKKI